MKHLLTAALITAGTMATAQGTRCLPRSVLIERLSENYGESLVGFGLQDSRSTIEIWANNTSGSYTVFKTGTSGLSCLISTGKNWHSVQVKRGDEL